MFIAAVGAVIVVGLVRDAPLHPLPALTPAATTGSVGVLLVLAAFADGCSALTGLEAIANATPSFRKPRQKRARGSEAPSGWCWGAADRPGDRGATLRRPPRGRA
ncbi:MAG: hypothetical protein JO287_02310 [Pseudonocardiales bacterium]|nr:hypothetical protein [Pseudonocardiales bacterium]